MFVSTNRQANSPLVKQLAVMVYHDFSRKLQKHRELVVASSENTPLRKNLYGQKKINQATIVIVHRWK
jgi:hypothetical protein